MAKLSSAVCAATTRWGTLALRLALGVIFLWFGLLKLVAEANLAAEVEAYVVDVVTFGAVEPQAGVLVLAWLQCATGVGLLFNIFPRFTLGLLAVLLLLSLSALVLVPNVTWADFMQPTTIGQYVLKDLVFLAAAAVLWARHCGARSA